MSDVSSGRTIWILGLLHSGTTIFWRSFQKDVRLTCFDEPFSGDLGTHFPLNNGKGTLDEILVHFSANPTEFWNLYEPVELWQELDAEFSAKQERYLKRLLNCGENVVIDETHLHLHLTALAKITPDCYVIHLYRRASGFVTSHLLPSIEQTSRTRVWIRQRLGRQYRKVRFGSRYDIPRGMRRDQVIGSHPMSKFGLLLSNAGYDAERIMRSAALVRLLAYWYYHYHFIERAGPEIFGNRFVSVSYERFASAPKETMSTLYDRIGMTPSASVSYAEVHSPKTPYRACDPRWRRAARDAGFTKDEIESLL